MSGDDLLARLRVKGMIEEGALDGLQAIEADDGFGTEGMSL